MPTYQPLMRRRVPPMLRRDDHSPQRWIIVNIIQLLLHHLIASNLLRMHTLVPNLMRTVPLMLCTVIGKLIEQPFALFQLDLLQ